jgi:hypothetical protein
MRSATREAEQLAHALGFEVRSGKKHLKVFTTSGQLVAVFSRGSHEGRQWHNFRACLLRAAREEEA